MQGFNKYYGPEFDPKQTSSLNKSHGKHALGDRARLIDKGILIVRFELPWNIWCGTCNAHIGAGVRYNAQKRKVGAYYSTPIFAFRCKCHLCDGWFEIRTDPQNARYVVHEGARKKQEDWDPEAEGGYAVHDTEAPSASDPTQIDAFKALEKTLDQKTQLKTKVTRLTALTEESDRLASDPYAVSRLLRDKFRAEKKVRLAKEGRDEGLRERYGLAPGLDLGDESAVEGSARFQRERERVKEREEKRDLAKSVRKNTARRLDPWDAAGSRTPDFKPRGVVKEVAKLLQGKKQKEVQPQPVAGLLAGYGSESD